MSALTIDLMGNTPLDEATIQARAQDIIAANWPQWKRERALRLGDVTALNAYMDEIAAEVDLARSNSALLAAAIAYEQAEDWLALPAYDGPLTIDTEDGPAIHPQKAAHDAMQASAQDIIDSASEQVVALVTSRIPPEPEPEPEPELMP